MSLKVPDYINVCQCLIFLDDTQGVADILDKLIREGQVRRDKMKQFKHSIAYIRRHHTLHIIPIYLAPALLIVL